LNEFFAAEGKGEEARFKYEDYVQKWLDLIRGAYMPTTTDELKLGMNEKPAMPYSDTRLLNVLTHTLWFLPSVAACYAMRNLLMQKQNSFYHDYKINVAAGAAAGNWGQCFVSGVEIHGEPLDEQNHHPFLWKINCRGYSEAVERHLHAAQSFQPGDLLSGGVSRSKPMGDYK